MMREKCKNNAKNNAKIMQNNAGVCESKRGLRVASKGVTGSEANQKNMAWGLVNSQFAVPSRKSLGADVEGGL
jgi:hypothetical protein